MGRIVGIDLGTTNSVVCTVGMAGCMTIQNKEGELQTRSIVGWYKDNFLIGSPALRRFPLAPKDTILSVKRLMGRGISDPEVERIQCNAIYDIVEPSDGTKDSLRIKLGDKAYSPVDISATILKKLKADTEFVLGEDVTHAVITVPAYFSDRQREATREAGLKAGLTVMKILDEPTAAAIAFGIEANKQDAEHDHAESEDVKTVLVYDLGGGTFDISVLMMAAGTYAALNLEGDMWLGGDNFDQIIVDYVLDYIKKEYGIDPSKVDTKVSHRFMATLKMEAQKTKEMLGAARTAEIIIGGILQDGSGNIIDIEIDITREFFEEKAKPLVDRTVFLTKKAIENAHLDIKDIDCVIMAGNSSAMPLVQQAMEQLFGKEKVSRKVHPKYCVAMGAAMVAASSGIICPKCDHSNHIDTKACDKCGTSLVGIVSKVRCPLCGTDNDAETPACVKCGGQFIKDGGPIGGIAPFNYGIQTAGDQFNIFIYKSDSYPTPEEKKAPQTFYTRFQNQRIISIPVYGGDHIEAAGKNEKMGDAFAILPPHCPERTAIRIKLWLDNSGIFDLNAHLENGSPIKSLILRGGLDGKAVDSYTHCLELYAKQKEYMKPDKAKELDKKVDDVLMDLGDNRFDDAIKKAEELKKDLDNITPQEAPTDEAMIAIGFGRHIVNEYAWLLGRSAYIINSLIEELESAIKQKDIPAKKEKTKELMYTINEQVKGKLLGALIGARNAIRSFVEPNNIAVARGFNEKLDEVEKAYKNNNVEADEMLDTFYKRLNEAITRFQPKCPVCKNEISKDTRYCSNPDCGADLWQITGSKIGTSSSTKNPH